MADAGAGRHHAEALERALRPLQEAIALGILLVFLGDVLCECRVIAEEGDGDRMVDDEIDRHQRVDPLGIAAEVLHRIPHRSKVDHGGDAGEILHQHAGRAKRDLAFGRLGLEPLRAGLDVFLADAAPVFIPQQIFEQNLHREGQAGNSLEAVFLCDRKAVIDI